MFLEQPGVNVPIDGPALFRIRLLCTRYLPIVWITRNSERVTFACRTLCGFPASGVEKPGTLGSPRKDQRAIPGQNPSFEGKIGERVVLPYASALEDRQYVMKFS